MVGFVLGARPRSVSLWPKLKEDRWVLGSVGFENLNIWNGVFVSFAPLAMLPLGAVAFYHWMLPAYAAQAYTSWFFGGYVASCCVYACLPSPTDVHAGAPSLLLYGALAYCLWFLSSMSLS